MLFKNRQTRAIEILLVILIAVFLIDIMLHFTDKNSAPHKGGDTVASTRSAPAPRVYAPGHSLRF